MEKNHDNDKPDYCLAKIDVPNITAVKALSESEYLRHTKQIVNLTRYISDQQLFFIVELNYNEFQKKSNFYFVKYSKDRRIDAVKIQKIYLDLNRLLLNLLSSIKTFLEHTETRLKRVYGHDSEEMKLFKSETAIGYDQHFEYRFLYKLRNYAQHCGLPSGSIEFTSEGEDVVQNSLKIFFDRDILLQNYKEWAVVKNDLLKRPERFEVLPIIEVKYNLLKEINKKISEKELVHYHNDAHELMQLLWESNTSRVQGIPIILKISGPVSNPNMSKFDFPFEIIGKITGVKMNIHIRRKPLDN